MAIGAPMMQALPLLMTGVRAIGGGMGRATAMAGPAGGAVPNMFDPTAAKPPPNPTPNPMFHDAPGGQPPAKPPMGAGAQVVRDPTQGPAPRAMLASDRIGPGSTHDKTSGPMSNRELGEQAGYKTETVMGKAVPLGSSPDAAPIQAAASSSIPKTVMDNVKSAAPPPQGGQPPKPPMGTPAPNMPPPGQRPPMPQQQSMFDRGVDMVTGGISDLQDKLGESSTNPLFQTGMGLLASGYDGSNPYTAIQAGLGGVQPALMEQTMADYGIKDKEREKELAEALAAIGLKYTPGGEKKDGEKTSRQAAGSAKIIRR